MVSKISLYKKNKANLRNQTTSSVAEPQSSPLTDERLAWIFENVNQKETSDNAHTFIDLFEMIKRPA